MALRVNNNPTAINAHRNVYQGELRLNKSYEKISSGLKIVRAADGPASLIISEQMRSQIRGVEQAIRNSETGIAMMQTTEASLDEVSRMLTELRSLAVHAANEAVNDELMLAADQQEITNIIDALDRIARNTSFGNRKMLDGTAGANGVTTGEGVEFVEANHSTRPSPNGGYEVRLIQAATKSGIVGTEDLTTDLARSGERLTIVDNGREATITGTEEDTAETMVSRLQLEADRNGLNVDVAMSNDRLSVTHREYGDHTSLFVYSDTDGVLSKEGGELEAVAKGKNIQGFINDEVAIGKGRILEGIEGNPSTQGIKVRYIGDAGTDDGLDIDPDKGLVVGRVNISQNSLRFQLGDSFDQNESVSIKSVFSSELANGVENESGFRSLRDIDVRSFEGANDSLRLIRYAIDKVASTRGDIGAFQKNLLEANLNSMMVLRENLVSSESTIRDADVAEEMSSLTRNQMLQQAALSMMSHATQEPRNILKLLQ